MCGIAGLSLAPEERTFPTRVAAAMLKEIEHRGPDATGVAYVKPESLEVFYAKAPIKARQFVATHLNLEGSRTAILHTRWATKGSFKVEENNHPIVVPGVVGVHNGQIRNDDDVFKALGNPERYGEVDSEAAFALIASDVPKQSIPERLSILRGTAALAWLTVDDEGLSDRVLHLARVDSSPLWLGQTKKGSTVFGSTRTTIVAAAAAMNTKLVFEHQVEEGTYLRVRRGVIIEWAAIPGQPSSPVRTWTWSKSQPTDPKAVKS